jgi:hypothetical protein
MIRGGRFFAALSFETRNAGTDGKIHWFSKKGNQ